MAYVSHLLADLDKDIETFAIDRPLHSIFIGGGTPSLFSAKAIEHLLTQVKQRFRENPDLEVTLEANPGTVEADKFMGFAKAGVNRLSIGVQSFESDKLIKLGRIHDSEQAIRAAEIAKQCGVKSFNLDLMHGLESQSVDNALDDLQQAIALNPQHISWYQLTIEPNTAFYSKPPTLPEDDVLWDIQQRGFALLTSAGYQQYEVSAFSKGAEYQAKHNLNYWQHGDYLGIGCGSHGKITNPVDNSITRTVKVKHPKGYMDADRDYLDQTLLVAESDRAFEYMMNRLRLFKPFKEQDFEQATGLPISTISQALTQAKDKKLLEKVDTSWQITPFGHRYLNDLLALFL